MRLKCYLFKVLTVKMLDYTYLPTTVELFRIDIHTMTAACINHHHLCFKAVFQTGWVRRTPSYGPPFYPVMESQVSTFSRFIVLPGLPRPADRRRPLHHKPCICLHTIGIVLSFYMSMPPWSASSHHIPNCLYT